MRAVLSVAATAVPASAAALGQDSGFPWPTDDAARGKVIAKTWCSSCHLVAPDENRTALADVPTFASTAHQLPDKAGVLTAFVVNPHPPMPELGLSRQDIRDLVAYIATLK